MPNLTDEVFTRHFGLVSNVLSKVWNELRDQNRLQLIQGRVQYGGALYGRDTTAVNRTANGLLRLLYLGERMPISDADLEGAVRLALECRRGVKERQRRYPGYCTLLDTSSVAKRSDTTRIPRAVPTHPKS